MIKIIISGTSDGFYPRYASDGVLDDDITNHLVDRRHYLSKEADRLSREGYSFQVLAKGVLFHKIIPLFDAFGRDGFMMASLYLPDGEKLKGTEIKDALDAIIREYKMHIVGGMANVELDWSFVKRKADEVNNKVYTEPWKSHPSPTNASRTALMKGADNRIAEYFDYPTPLRDGFSGYEQVFLTERLLDPALESSDGEQGYKVLTKDDVDIDNPTYVIDYINPNGYSTRGLKHEVTKKELDAQGSFLCGELSKDGYRKQIVIIPEGKKQSQDGETIKVELPTLVPKQASVLLKVVDSNTGTEIPWGNYSVSWKGSQYYDPDRVEHSSQSPLFNFEKEECDQKWKVRVESEQYDENELQIIVNDGEKRKSVCISLQYNPEWTIEVITPVKREKSRIRQNEKDNEITKIKRDLEREGFVITDLKQNSDNRSIKVEAEYPLWEVLVRNGSKELVTKQVREIDLNNTIDELKNKYITKGGLVFIERKDGNRKVELLFGNKPMTTANIGNNHSENVFKDPSRNGVVTEPPKEPEKKKWVLQLDEESKKYSIFKKCKKKAELAIKAKQDLDKLNSALESFSMFYKNSGNDAKTVDFVKGQIGLIIEELPKGHLKNARKHYDNARNKLKDTKLGNNKDVEELINYADDALKSYVACLKIPTAIVNPKNVVYDDTSHRLILEQEQKPDGKSKPKFGEDHYSYSFEEKRLDWFDEGDFYADRKEHTIVRKLRGIYKFLWFVLPLIVIGGAGAAWYFGFRPPVNDEIVNLTKSLEVAIDSLNKYENYYCDDTLYNDYNSLSLSYSTIKNKNEKKTGSQEMRKLDSVYGVFAGLFEVQKEFKMLDDSIYAKLEYLKDSTSTWGLYRVKFEDLQQGDNFKKMIAPMSNSHKKEVERWYNERLKETPEPSNGNTPGGIEDHQKIINGPKTLFDKARSYTNVINGFSGYDISNLSTTWKPYLNSIVNGVNNNNIDQRTYETYYKQASNESTNGEKVKKLDALIWGRETLNDSQPPTGVQLQEPIKITRAQDLFNVLIWDNVCQTRTHFNNLYTLDIGRQTQNYSDKLNGIIGIIHTKGISKSTYDEKYQAATESNGGASDKIDYLLNALEQL